MLEENSVSRERWESNFVKGEPGDPRAVGAKGEPGIDGVAERGCCSWGFGFRRFGWY